MAITAWGLMLIPACGPNGEKLTSDEVNVLPLDNLQKENLKSLVDALIPKTDTLGAVELNIHNFIDKILANCYESEVQKQFVTTLGILENKSQERFKKSFYKCGQLEREEMLLSMDNEKIPIEKEFFDLSKELVILGFTTSEYYLTNFTNYEMVPGGYDGCVPVPNEPFKI